MGNVKTLYIVYVGDERLSRASMEVLAVCTTITKAVEMAKRDAEDINEELSAYDEEMLREYSQTQGRDENYLIEPIKANRLLK